MMSTECESVVSPSLGPETIPHPLAMPSNGMRTDRETHSSISYEGRVSLISPLNNYEATMTAAFGLEHPSNSIPSPHPLHSPTFNSLHHHGFLNSDPMTFPFSIQPQNHSTPGNSRDLNHFISYQQAGANEIPMPIKQERIDSNVQRCRAEDISKATDTSVNHDGSGAATEQESMDLSNNHLAKSSVSHQRSKEFVVSSSELNLESIAEKDFLVNGENSSDSDPPYPFQDNEEGPGSAESDIHDSREMENDPMSYMNTSFDGKDEVIHHGENSKSLKCQFCSYSTDSKTSFSSHLNLHFDHKCMKCDFTTQTVDQLKEHLQEEHGLTEQDVENIENTRVPRVNSQGKVKTFKCKQCGYIAITKSDFWKHAKTHIKSEKLLSCSKCLFVTEYKHHLEYHMRNHFGSKPYKCNKCSYSCVNKSMLNSHMKSHSNIYQYRCSDCTYATKYCHSLKLHLRKYGHTPAMVLNPDGSPNPVPIIDIYGTRRGPKLKKDENGMPILPPQYQLQAQFMRAHMEVTGTIPPAPTVPPEKHSSKPGGVGIPLSIPPPPPAFPGSFPFSGNVQGHPSFIPHEFKESNKSSNQENNAVGKSNESGESGEKLNVSKSPEVQESFKCEICNFSTQSKDILNHHKLLHEKENEEAEKRLIPPPIMPGNDTKISLFQDFQPEMNHTSTQSTMTGAPRHAHQRMPPQFATAQNTLHEYFARAMNPLLYSPLLNSQSFVHPALEFQQQLQRLVYQNSKEHIPMKETLASPSPIKLNTEQTESVLDLSKEHTPPNAVSSSQQHSSSSSPSFLPASPPNWDVSTPPSKSRRKGRAYKLERIALRLSGSGEEGEGSCSEGSEAQKEPERRKAKENDVPPLLPLSLSESKVEQVKENGNGKWGEAHQCQYCDIAFKDVMMYTMHMGYHGYKDPFTCNMCGFEAADKLAFFLHIGRSSHL